MSAFGILDLDSRAQTQHLRQQLDFWGVQCQVFQALDEVEGVDLLLLMDAPSEESEWQAVAPTLTVGLLEPDAGNAFQQLDHRLIAGRPCLVFRHATQYLAYALALHCLGRADQVTKPWLYVLAGLVGQFEQSNQRIEQVTQAMQQGSEEAVLNALEGGIWEAEARSNIVRVLLEELESETDVSLQRKLQIYEKVAAIDPSRTDILLKWSEALFEADQYNEGDEIRAQLDFELKVKLSALKSNIDKGLYYNSQQEYKEAKLVLNEVLEDLEWNRQMHADYFDHAFAHVHHILGALYLNQSFSHEEEVSRRSRDYGKAHIHLVQAYEIRKRLLDNSRQDSTAENTACIEFVQTALSLSRLHDEANEERFANLRNLMQAKVYAESAISAIEQLAAPNKDVYQPHLNAINTLLNLLPEDDAQRESLNQSATKLRRLKEGATSVSVFISFSSRDAEIKEWVKDALQESGVKVVDYENDMLLGERIKDFIARSIEENSFTLNLISRNSLLSAWVAEELLQNADFKAIKGKRYVPCLVDETLFDDSFVLQARGTISEELQSLRGQMIDQLRENEPIEHLYDQFKLKERLYRNVASLVTKLRSIGCPNLTPSHFEEEIEKLVGKIIREGVPQ